MMKSNQYDILRIVPKRQIFKIYLRCLVANLILLIKWLFESVKNRVNQTTIIRRAIERTEFPNRQPNFMTETKMGRHSYVKLEVTYFFNIFCA